MFRVKDYPELFLSNNGSIPGDLLVIDCYTTCTGGGMALVSCFKRYCLVFVDSKARRLTLTQFAGGWTEFGCSERARDIAEIIGATKIEE